MEATSSVFPRTPSGLVVPRIHANGTNKHTLLDAIEAAYYALDNAYDALKPIAPNPRDYDSESFGRAWSQHGSRLQRIDDVYKELSELAVAISEQTTT